MTLALFLCLFLFFGGIQGEEYVDVMVRVEEGERERLLELVFALTYPDHQSSQKSQKQNPLLASPSCRELNDTSIYTSTPDKIGLNGKKESLFACLTSHSFSFQLVEEEREREERQEEEGVDCLDLEVAVGEKDCVWKYQDYETMTSFLQDIVQKFPEESKLFSIGQSVEGRELWVIKISGNVQEDEEEPHFKYIANMHGDEVVGRQMCLYLIHDLLYLKETNDDYKQLIGNTALFIMPTMNPDGFYHNQRRNANNVDINRNFPDQFVEGDQERQPEVQAVMDFCDQYPFILSANLHGGAVVANYAYDGRPDGSTKAAPSICPDDAVFQEISTIYATSHLTMSKSKEFEGGITNGADWYPLYGGMQDYNYVYKNTFEITLELSTIKYPSVSTLEGFWEQNKPAMVNYMKRVLHSQIQGQVMNENNEAISGAIVSVESIDKDFKTSSSGWFYRLLTPGKYTVTISHPQYNPSTVLLSIDSSSSPPTTFFPILHKKVDGGGGGGGGGGGDEENEEEGEEGGSGAWVLGGLVILVGAVVIVVGAVFWWKKGEEEKEEVEVGEGEFEVREEGP